MRYKNLVPLLLAVFPWSNSCAPTIAAGDLSEAVIGTTFNRQGDYIIGGTDEISVKVFGENTMTGNYTVSPTGILAFPLIGFVQVDGLTSLQLEQKLEAALKPYIKGPRVTVVVVNRSSYEVFFSGEMNRPGAVKLQNRTTLIQGIAVAGGLSKFASGRIVVLRYTGDGKVNRYAVTYPRLLSGYKNLDRFVLERGDVIHAE